MNTDASFRFERGIDPQITSKALSYAAKLVVELAGGTIEGKPYDIKQELPKAYKFMLSYEQINNTIGQEISKDEVSKILTGLEIKIENSNEGGMLVEIPQYRVDVTRPADVIEEILRVYGYNNVKISTLLKTNLPDFEISNDHQITERLSNQLVCLGFHEMINNSINSPDYGKISKISKPRGVTSLIHWVRNYLK